MIAATAGWKPSCTWRVTSFLPHKLVEHADSVGLPAPVCDVRLDESIKAGDGVGELLVRGPNVVAGYGNRDGSDAFVDGWLHTGDVPRIDEQGLIDLVDRIKT